MFIVNLHYIAMQVHYEHQSFNELLITEKKELCLFEVYLLVTVS